MGRHCSRSYDGDGIDEIIAARNCDGNLYMLKLSDSKITQIASYTQFGQGSGWTGIAAGDFDGDGIDEFIAHRNYDGDFYIFELNNGNIENIGKEYFPVNQENGILGAGNFNDTGFKDDLIAIRNFDGDIFIYSIDIESIASTCTDLVLNDIVLQSGTQNEYIARNSITAETNFIVEQNANVVFRSGNQINLKPGFHADYGSVFHGYIDPSIECVPINKTSIVNTPMVHSKPDMEKSINDLSVQDNQVIVYLNPSDGILNLKVVGYKDERYSVYVFDALGKTVYYNHNIIGESFLINLKSRKPGIYFVVINLNNEVYKEKISIK